MTWKCKEKCGECCGMVHIPKSTWEKHKHKARLVKKFIEIDDSNEVVAIGEDTSCVFLKDFKCAIYEDRPDICRQYGLSDELPCPYIKPNGNPRSPAKVKRIQRKINHDIDVPLVAPFITLSISILNTSVISAVPRCLLKILEGANQP